MRSSGRPHACTSVFILHTPVLYFYTVRLRCRVVRQVRPEVPRSSRCAQHKYWFLPLSAQSLSPGSWSLASLNNDHVIIITSSAIRLWNGNGADSVQESYCYLSASTRVLSSSRQPLKWMLGPRQWVNSKQTSSWKRRGTMFWYFNTVIVIIAWRVDYSFRLALLLWSNVSTRYSSLFVIYLC